MQQKRNKDIKKARAERTRQLNEARKLVSLTSDETSAKKEENGLCPQDNGVERYETLDGRPSYRLFPRNAVYSTRMYRKVVSYADDNSGAVADNISGRDDHAPDYQN